MSVPAAQQSLAPRFEAKVGTLEWYCLDHWTRDLGMDLKTLKREHREHIRFLPGAQEFLARACALAANACRIVTNAHRDTFAVKAEHTGIDRLVDAVVCSHDFAAPKESAAFWHALEEHEPFDAAPHAAASRTASPCSRRRARTACGTRSRFADRTRSCRRARSPSFSGVDGVFELV